MVVWRASGSGLPAIGVSALGHEQTYALQKSDVRFTLKATITSYFAMSAIGQ
jgi:hypothetical protein